MSVFCKANQCGLNTKPRDRVLVDDPEPASPHTTGGKKCILTTPDNVRGEDGTAWNLQPGDIFYRGKHY